MTNEEAKAKLEAYIMCESKKSHFDCGDYKCDDNCPLFYEMGTVGEHNEAINVAIQALTAISELSKSLKAVNRYEMDKKVLIGFNMAVAIFNKCFGEIGEMSERQTDGDLIPRQSVLTMLQKIENAVEDGDGFQFNEWIEYAKDIPRAEKTAEWIFYMADNDGNDGTEEKWCKCSKCGYKEFYLPPKRSICPNCKSRMK